MMKIRARYGLVSAPSSWATEFTFSAHAQARMAQRNITKADVLAALANPTMVVPDGPSKIRVTDELSYVGVILNTETKTVVTVYNANKVWRNT